ncbi:hypothetical protein SETIT_1G216900v2 [Setaria italica]|uniref:Uncharacterized protein n=1 Tax=Setaria italica TaxID=4555 RepID=A0A368PN70_SETIT|nr:hypothetical protein SETIT_1G216900v2 [Setaria italica]
MTDGHARSTLAASAVAVSTSSPSMRWLPLPIVVTQPTSTVVVVSAPVGPVLKRRRPAQLVSTRLLGGGGQAPPWRHRCGRAPPAIAGGSLHRIMRGRAPPPSRSARVESAFVGPAAWICVLARVATSSDVFSLSSPLSDMDCY